MEKSDRKDARLGYRRVRLDRILTPPVRDEVDDEVVCAIAESFPLSGGGPINPITVRRVVEKEDGEKVVKTVLVAGAHRLEAARRSGLEHIDCKFFEGDETEARIVQVEENLFRKHLTVLQRAELLAEWVKLAMAKGYISGQLVQKNKWGRPQGGFSKSARELPVVGRSVESRRKMIARATKIASISPTAKDIAKACGLEDNQEALLKIAKAGHRKAQVRKAKELGDRLRSGVGADRPFQKGKTNGAFERPPLPDSNPDAGDPDDENANNILQDTTLDELETVWREAGGPKLWRHAPFLVREEFTGMLRRARCAARVDLVSFLQDVFRGRKEIYARELYCFAKTKGIQKKALREQLRGSQYRRKKRGSRAGAPWAYLNKDRNWKEHLRIISDDELRSPFAAECKRDADIVQEFAHDAADDAYYDLNP
jgi:hypothetical protein